MPMSSSFFLNSFGSSNNDRNDFHSFFSKSFLAPWLSLNIFLIFFNFLYLYLAIIKHCKINLVSIWNRKRLYAQSNLKVSLKEHLINFVSGHKYLGVTLDPSLSMNDHLQKTLKSVAVRIRLLKRMRHSLSNFAAESVYKAIVLPKILYCSTPVLKVSDTMANKFERLQKRAIKIIHNRRQSCKECGLMTIQNQKTFKAAIQIFKYLQETAIQHLASYIEKVDHTSK